METIPYQKCPVCNGSGVDYSPYSPITTSATSSPCTACNGAKMIPEYIIHENNSTKVNFPEASDFKERRKKLNLSMQDVTDVTGIGKPTISRIEKGNNVFYKTGVKLWAHYEELEDIMNDGK